MTPPKVLTKVANSAKHRATEFLNTVRNRLESPTLIRRGGVPHRRIESADRSNSNLNNADINGYETSSVQTTSTSSSTHSGFLGFALPTTVNATDPLPVPTCRLGAYQAEWLTDVEGTWKLITENATVAPVDQPESIGENSLTLRRRNRALKKERKFLKIKLEILCDELVKRTALVHQQEKLLDHLRSEVKIKMGETPESVRSELRRELENKLENTRSKNESRLDIMTPEGEENHFINSNSLSESMSLEQFEHRPKVERNISSTQHVTANLLSKPPVEKDKTDTVDCSQTEGKPTPSALLKPVLKLYSVKGEPKSSGSELTEDTSSEATSNASNSKTNSTETNETHNDDSNNETTKTVTNKESETEDDMEEEQENDDDNEEGGAEEEEEEGEEEEEEMEEELEDEEEELSKTDESLTDPTIGNRRRVVQFGTVSRR
ncbi:hypothetical protein EG68_06002 [Paragonimus skrjabini miyazakii]|uniref:Uncharacterized protein n=1 Tax=Paragonimus skrjabini miyazakii TaxID=59628 RepID=A0A8S9YVQ2_9TREM|nr:hypothetical protein EG68_06002 [Paragonimus skrjabini miyazakii]